MFCLFVVGFLKNVKKDFQLFSGYAISGGGSVAQWITRLTTDQEIPGLEGRFGNYYAIQQGLLHP